jgi:hypothetical protein
VVGFKRFKVRAMMPDRHSRISGADFCFDSERWGARNARVVSVAVAEPAPK